VTSQEWRQFPYLGSFPRQGTFTFYLVMNIFRGSTKLSYYLVEIYKYQWNHKLLVRFTIRNYLAKHCITFIFILFILELSQSQYFYTQVAQYLKIKYVRHGLIQQYFCIPQYLFLNIFVIKVSFKFAIVKIR
jgi:hypothetical protein